MPCHATYSPVVRPSIAAVRARLLPVIVPFRSSSSRRPSLRRQAPPPAAPAAAVVVPLPLLLLALPPDALAVNGELGILEGRSVALLHPLVMGALFAYTLWAGYLGWQWRRVRTLQDDINALKTQQLTTPKPPAAVEAEIERLAEERRRLLKGSFRDRHFDAGSILLGLGVLESVGGALDTWFRNGQLFPEPHLFAGAAITVLWEAAAALVPPMQKGNETARNLHILLNAINVLLFVWQIPTGLDILGKVFEDTTSTWP